MQRSEFAGAVAVVAGAGQGIGMAVARALVAEGAVVAAVDRNSGALAGLAAESSAVRPYVLDVTDSQAVDSAVELMEHQLSSTGVLVNTARVLRPLMVALALAGALVDAGALPAEPSSD